MTETIDTSQEIFESVDIHPVEYGGFWVRFGALFIDGIFLASIIILERYNNTSWKSFGMIFLIFLFGICYKLFMEYKFGATIGKMATNLKVVGYDLKKASLLKIVGRNIFFIAYRLILAIITICKYLDPKFQEIHKSIDYNKMQTANHYNARLMLIFLIICIVEGIMLSSDSRKRSLHDRIGGTVVIKKF